MIVKLDMGELKEAVLDYLSKKLNLDLHDENSQTTFMYEGTETCVSEAEVKIQKF